MKNVHLIGFYQFGTKMGCLRRLKAGKTTISDFNFLAECKNWLEFVCHDNGKGLVPIPISLKNARHLLECVTRLETEAQKESFCISEQSIIQMNRSLTEFETVFAAEVPNLAAFFVPDKRNYSTPRLIEHADNEFPEAVKKRLSTQAITDIKNAGRAIAFELGTAAGIHSFRALEAVALDYLVKRSLNPSKRDLYTYFDMLKADGADEKVIQIGQQLRGLRRNPLAHPEDNLDVDEAIEAFQLCTTAITALVKDMEKRGLFPS